MWLARPQPSLRYRVYCAAFAVGALAHLTLPDAWQDGWLVPDACLLVGALIVALGGGLLGWLLCFVGVAAPLLLLADQLTQSAYMLLCIVAALGCFLGRPETRAARLDRAFFFAVRLLTVGTYAIAAFHKVNRDFLDPAVSCASGGMGILAENWSIPALASPSLAPLWAPLFLSAEVSVAILWIVRPGLALVLALLVHIPLTVIFAPAFAFVMIPGWLSFLTDEDLRHFGRVWQRHHVLVLSIGLALGATSLGLYFRHHWIAYWLWFAKEIALYIALAFAVVAFVRRPAGVFRWLGAWREGWPRRRGAFAITLLCLWIVNGMTPYLGIQYHHAAAMLSNLRVDPGCWNSLIVPESVRIEHPFIRIERAQSGAKRGAAVLEADLTDTLWTPDTLWHALRHWCPEGAGPLRVRARTDHGTVDVADLCRTFPFGRPLVPGWARFEHNLSPSCPQRCIH